MTKRYNKLVRDKIPEIIRKRGEYPVTHKATDEEYEPSLNRKLIEEVREYLSSGKAEELADILEIVYAIGNFIGISEKELNEIRMNKAKKKGRFLDRIILEKAE